MSIIKPIHIALDLDEVISPMLPHLVTFYINKYHKGNMNFYSYYMRKPVKCGYKYSEIFNISNYQAKILVRSFYTSIEAKQIRPYSTSVKAIHNLKKRDAKLSIVTGRQTYPECKQLTHAFVGNYFGSCIDNIYFTNSYSLEGECVSKKDICDSIDADIHVDDCTSNFKNITSSKLLTVQYMHYPIHNWTDIEYYDSITDLDDLQKYID